MAHQTHSTYGPNCDYSELFELASVDWPLLNAEHIETIKYAMDDNQWIIDEEEGGQLISLLRDKSGSNVLHICIPPYANDGFIYVQDQYYIILNKDTPSKRFLNRHNLFKFGFLLYVSLIVRLRHVLEYSDCFQVSQISKDAFPSVESINFALACASNFRFRRRYGDQGSCLGKLAGQRG